MLRFAQGGAEIGQVRAIEPQRPSCNWFVPAARSRPSRQSLYSSSLLGGRHSLLGDVLCAEQLSEGLEQAIMKMRVGEKAEIAIQPQYAFGAEASRQPLAVVPPQSTVVYTLELVDMEKVRLCDPRLRAATRQCAWHRPSTVHLPRASVWQCDCLSKPCEQL